MTQSRGPDISGRRYASLNEALRAHRIPLENWEFIRTFTGAIDIVAYYGTTGYIKAVRREGEPALNITYGWSNGFRSDEEFRGALGEGAEIWRSGRGTGQWGVTHPMHGTNSSGRRQESLSASGQRDFGTCPVCRTQFSASGACFCD